jgi:hypothetical protein
LDCIRELSMSISDNERIWLTNVGYREGNRFTISGKASDPKTPVNFPTASRPILISPTSACPAASSRRTRRPREVSFTVSFQFNPWSTRAWSLTKRERYIGIRHRRGAGDPAAGPVHHRPAMTRMDELDAKIAEAQQQHLNAQQLFTSSRRANRDWKTIAGRCR